MNELPVEPLFGEKPRWFEHQRRDMVRQLYWFFPVVLVAIAFGLYLNQAWIMFLGFFGPLAGCIVIGNAWMRRYGLWVWEGRIVLYQVDGVPCPNCLYPLCGLDDAAGEKLCAECGCRIDGVEAMDAWRRVDGLKMPIAWREHFVADDELG